MTPNRHFDDVMTSRPLFVPRPEEAGAFQVESHGEEGMRLTMREPHFANNVRYVLILDRAQGQLRARWSDTEDYGDTHELGAPKYLEIGLA